MPRAFRTGGCGSLAYRARYDAQYGLTHRWDARRVRAVPYETFRDHMLPERDLGRMVPDMLTDLLKLLPIVGPAIARGADFVGWYHAALDTLHPADQVTAKAALADIQTDNDAGHARLQAKLASASVR